MSTNSNDYITPLTIRLDDYYVVTALEDGNRVYVGFDSASGGYPYWRMFEPQRKHENLFSAIKEMKDDVYGIRVAYMQRNVTDIGVAKVSTTLTMIDIESDEVLQQMRQAALDKLTEEEQVILGLK